METLDFTTLIAIILPALITGAVAYYFFQIHIKNENNRRNFLLVKEEKKQTLPLRIQAYERITLFLERIKPSQLLVRVKPLCDSKEAYSSLLLNTIEQEFEHNVSQQIYISEECWNVITSSKNATAHLISETMKKEKINNSQELRESVLIKMIDTTPPSSVALSFLKSEAQQLF